MANRAVGNSLSAILKTVEARVEGVRDEFLKNVAEELVLRSPVDTGYYVMSHKISTEQVGGRFTNNFSQIGPRNQNQSFFQETALNGLVYDIEGLPKDTTKIFIGNTAPHALAVEYGGPNWKNNPDGYQVYSATKNKMPELLQDAIQKVKGR